ncbi:DoxX family membrane protein [Dyadobacter sediminis]|uniref:DoxX family membrane protein n=1 Tax=Dyadobacter sediminis TaxID=1493691 RepID=A0A5R9KJ62_9BACT|nr:DoxX family membrane protein [Dyadobacter sediminis]TLU96257.1 DoxX family membrane protein [Dyadobacter sediminis]
MTDNFQWGFLMARLAAGMSMFGHGLVRLPKLNGFSHWMVEQFQKSMLPDAIVIPFSYVLPVAEFTIGLLLLLGLFTRNALMAAGLVMVALLFGSSMIEEWSAIPSQLLHAAFFAVLLCYTDLYNQFSLDQKFRK